MKKKLALILTFALVLILTACGKAENSGTSAPAAPESTAAATEDTAEERTDILPFAKDGEIYFDIKAGDAVKDFGVKVDGQAVPSSGGAIKYTEKSAITFEGTGNAEKSVNVYIVMAVKEDGHYSFTQSINKDLSADKVVERLPQIMSGVLGGTTKIYVAITQDPKGWDHGLNEKLNELLEAVAE